MRRKEKQAQTVPLLGPHGPTHPFETGTDHSRISRYKTPGDRFAAIAAASRRGGDIMDLVPGSLTGAWTIGPPCLVFVACAYFTRAPVARVLAALVSGAAVAGFHIAGMF